MGRKSLGRTNGNVQCDGEMVTKRKRRSRIFSGKRRCSGPKIDSFGTVHKQDVCMKTERKPQTNLSLKGDTLGEEYLGKKCNASNKNQLVGSPSSGRGKSEKEHPSSLAEVKIKIGKRNRKPGKCQCHVPQVDSFETLHVEDVFSIKEHDPQTDLSWEGEENFVKNSDVSNQICQVYSPPFRYEEKGKVHPSSLEEERINRFTQKKTSGKRCLQSAEFDPRGNSVEEQLEKKNNASSQNLQAVSSKNLPESSLSSACYHPFSPKEEDAQNHKKKNKSEKQHHYFLRSHHKSEKQHHYFLRSHHANGHHDKRESALQIQSSDRQYPRKKIQYPRKKIQSSDLEPNEVNVEIKGERQYPSSLSNQIGDHHLAVDAKENPVHVLSPPPEGPIGSSRKKLLVLNVNGLLADILPVYSVRYRPDKVFSGKAVFKRPFCIDFLKFCFQKFEVGLWSSRIRKNLDFAVDFLLGDLKDHLLFCWHQSHCTETGFMTIENRHKPLLLKELKKLWEKQEAGLPWERGEYNESNTLLLDDLPYKALRNPPYTAIFPPPYCYVDRNDDALGPCGSLRVYLESLAVAENVQTYVQHNPFGQEAISEASVHWEYYNRVLTSQHCRLASSLTMYKV